MVTVDRHCNLSGYTCRGEHRFVSSRCVCARSHDRYRRRVVWLCPRPRTRARASGSSSNDERCRCRRRPLRCARARRTRGCRRCHAPSRRRLRLQLSTAPPGSRDRTRCSRVPQPDCARRWQPCCSCSSALTVYEKQLLRRRNGGVNWTSTHKQSRSPSRALLRIASHRFQRRPWEMTSKRVVRPRGGMTGHELLDGRIRLASLTLPACEQENDSQEAEREHGLHFSSGW